MAGLLLVYTHWTVYKVYLFKSGAVKIGRKKGKTYSKWQQVSLKPRLLHSGHVAYGRLLTH